MSKGSFEGIKEKGEEALNLSQRIGDKARQSRSLMYIALGLFHEGRTEEAIEPFKKSAQLAGEAGDRRLQGVALNSAAVMLQQSGDYPEALHFYNESLALAREQKDLNGEATQLRSIGGLYLETHDYAQADDALQKSLELSRELKASRLEYAVLIKLGKLELERRNFESALKYCEQGSSLESKITERALKLESRDVATRAYFHLGNFAKAMEATSQMLEFARATKVALAIAQALEYLAELQLKLGHPKDSLASSGEAASLFHNSGANPSLEAGVLFTHAQAQRALGQTDEALSDLWRAIALLERARLTLLPTESARAEFVAGNSYVFLEAADLLISLGRYDEALAVSEAYHARGFLDLLVESRANLRRILPKDLLDKEESILKKISTTQRDLLQESLAKNREQELKKELVASENALEQFQLEVRRSNPQYASLKHLEPLSAPRIQSEMLDAQTGLIEYFVGKETSFAWLVTKDKVSFAALPGAKELNRLVGEYRKVIAERSSTAKPETFNNHSRELYRTLIQPFEGNISSLHRLIIVPDGALTYVPFETLASDRRASKATYLIERFAIGYEPSASALAAIKTAHSQMESRGLVAFGDPVYRDSDTQQERSATPVVANIAYYAERGLDLRRLPYTRTEVNTISALFPVADRRVFLGVDANEMKVKSESLERYRYLHFATHAFVDEESPARSGVILSLQNNEKEDGILQMTEIMRLKLNADLVTLSACRTGLGKIVGGEGVLGLTRAFLYAGSRSVVASLWNVNDTATAELMKAFYANLKRGQSKDEALRQAKLSLLHSKQTAWRHPYYWAPFVLVGANN